MKLGIVGMGVVGVATTRCWVEHAEVRCYDTVKERRTDTLDAVLDTGMVFVCLPTPMSDTGRADLGVVREFFHGVKGSRTLFALRSTVPVGTTQSLRDMYDVDVCHYPEFLTARCSVADAMTATRQLVGGYSNAAHTLVEMLAARYGAMCVHHMRAKETELVKLITNGFFAVKLAYFNEVRKLAKRSDANWGRVMEAVLLDGRIAHSHTRVPGPDGRCGFGGACLPKDLASLVSCLGAEAVVTRAAMDRNEGDRLCEE